MLESSDGSQRITTAKLAASVGVSEAALYRHFPSKTRMFESLIEFIEDSLITRINLILKDEKDTTARLRLIVLLLLGFGERNPGLTRASVGVSEAALYRHFPSKTRMFDSLIEFIEDSLITRINLILKDEKDTTARLRLIVLLLLGFGERNPGLTRILSGHALMFEQDRLQGRINQLFERIEAQLRQVLREKRMREGEGYTTDETNA